MIKNQKKRRLIIALLCVLVLSSMVVFWVISSSSKESSVPFSVVLDLGSDESVIVPVRLQNDYYLFFPADTEAAIKYTIKGKGYKSVQLDSGDLPRSKTEFLFTEGLHTLDVAEKGASSERFDLHVLYSGALPALLIETEEPITWIHEDKSRKTGGTATYLANGETVFRTQLSYLKGRGSSTWTAETEKKPYNIKFTQDVKFGKIAPGKKFCLLANFFDVSLIKNALAFYFSEQFGLCTMEYEFVDLYINGDYRGNYLLCESVQVEKERVNISNLEKENEAANPGVDIDELDLVTDSADGRNRYYVDLPNDPVDITGGYLLGYESIPPEDNDTCRFDSYFGQQLELKDPGRLSLEEMNYISDLVWRAENAILSETGVNGNGQHYTDLYDNASLADGYILEEWFENIDTGSASTFFYINKGGQKLVFGPVWDFDHSVVKTDEIVNIFFPMKENKWWVNTVVLNGSTVFSAAFFHEDFRETVTSRWKTLRAQVLSPESISSAVDRLVLEIKISAILNGLRWETDTDREKLSQKYQKDIDLTKACLIERAALLDCGFSEENAMLYYYFEGEIVAVDEEISATGEAKEINRIKDQGSDLCFNTAADFSGENYAPGETILLTEKTTKLYGYIP